MMPASAAPDRLRQLHVNVPPVAAQSRGWYNEAAKLHGARRYLTLPVMLLVFHVPFNGSFLILYLVSGLFLLTTLGLGLFVSTLVKTQQQAMLFATFFVAMPFVLLSGFIFPVENMPPLLGAVSALIPMKYYLTCVRGVFLKGVGLDVLWREALVLLVWGVGILTLATAKFHKRLD